ncbi:MULTISPECIES: hypothetical protein [Bombella]|uniref:Lipoprotein n=1 Tax=Bombella pollinis TaxID=2967337 RepID=A0ABT3WMT3_9PROT|nr:MULTISPECIES: hypothetical protein [Bombella]MCX5619968.1 hypothetical protein [Bombella pollinis]MUG90706.1 hypothetical protein [Bombella sp. ESL0385]
MTHRAFRSLLTSMLGSAALFGLASLGGCVRPAAPYLAQGQLLSQAGFVAHPANTTARYGLMNSLPDGSITYRMAPDGQRIYLYADPLACGCVYMGDEQAYGALQAHIKQTMSHKKHAHLTPSQELIAAMTAENHRDTTPWDWTIWSPAADPDSNQPRHMIGDYW